MYAEVVEEWQEALRPDKRSRDRKRVDTYKVWSVVERDTGRTLMAPVTMRFAAEKFAEGFNLAVEVYEGGTAE